MPTYTFTGPRVTTKRTGECPTCGKKATRSRTFERTVNPFNKRADGTPKGWDEVRVDVRAEAEAWAPGPEVFEHDACLAARTAPPRAKPIPVASDRIERSKRIHEAMAALADFTHAAGLPLAGADFQTDRDLVAASIAFVPAGEIVAWARALGLTEAPVEDGGHCTYVRLSGAIDGPRHCVTVKVHAAISEPRHNQLGGAPVEWRRDRDTGRKTGSGTVPVDALAEGLAVMGIAVADPTLAGSTGGAPS